MNVVCQYGRQQLGILEMKTILKNFYGITIKNMQQQDYACMQHVKICKMQYAICNMLFGRPSYETKIYLLV